MPNSVIKINTYHTYYDEGIRKFRNTSLPLDGKYEDEIGSIHYFKKGKYHNENGPAFIDSCEYEEYYIDGKVHRIDGPAAIYPGGNYYWYANGYYIDNEIMNNWLTENNIPLDWKKWTDSDKMLFALYWSSYNG